VVVEQALQQRDGVPIPRRDLLEPGTGGRDRAPVVDQALEETRGIRLVGADVA
jgi:hypothetical protein